MKACLTVIVFRLFLSAFSRSGFRVVSRPRRFLKPPRSLCAIRKLKVERTLTYRRPCHGHGPTFSTNNQISCLTNQPSSLLPYPHRTANTVSFGAGNGRKHIVLLPPAQHAHESHNQSFLVLHKFFIRHDHVNVQRL